MELREVEDKEEFKNGQFYKCPHLGGLVICTDNQKDQDTFSGTLIKDAFKPLFKPAGHHADDWLKFAFVEADIDIIEK